MGTSRKGLPRRDAAIGNTSADLWLRGDERCSVFFMGKPVNELASLWDVYGDDDAMFWRKGMMMPITREQLDAYENLWLGSGDDEYIGLNSFLIGKHYSDAEKESLWNQRGDKKKYRWQPGMWRPAPVEAV